MPRSKPKIAIQRIYDTPVDGYRVLVDRLWPRGVSRDAARLDEWLRDLAPSAKLRQWFNHEPARWEKFRAQYRAELAPQQETLARLRDIAQRKKLVLLYAAKNEDYNNARVIQEILNESS
ncbi:MAG TPA: DUF488 family protein [Kiritimatiellia bacterium]|jgi:uncharacterized protein YeaO (DUF488 family)|nr:MAG: hypothetical protein BWX54_00443 [Verrucomicrobia bacterium ADurb.Bin018]HOD99584.1 DUF488 family protein [Kiritimatiellia bacterium]HOE37835.1 DUF488 family protein [Kiritimatiellia bacterium]HOR75208.1 DUF488 family protein [Kiritimatiellia bacterium]HOU58040.1 DUF488 family protein [Kiritimatiellia bacterium]